MRAMLQADGETCPIDPGQLEEEVRRGLVLPDARVHYPPWTGEGWLRVDELPALAEALEAPPARLGQSLRAWTPPVVTGLLVLILLLCGVVQMVVAVLAPERLEGLFAALSVGTGGLVLDGRPWTPWTSQLIHAGPIHMIANFPIIAYCGFRAERALGHGGVAIVTAAAVAVGALFISLFSTVPVLGSSIIGYGLWGAQIAAGFRFGDELPPAQRKYYGWGNLVFFIPLFAAGILAPEVSHLGHLGGLLGGGLAAFFLPAETAAPRLAVAGRARRNFGAALLIGLSPSVIGLAAGLAPRLSHGPWETVTHEEAGYSLSLPADMADHPMRLAGLRAWVVETTDEEAVFAGLSFASDLADFEDPASFWGERLGGTFQLAAAPDPLQPGWDARAFSRPAGDDLPALRVVEQRLLRGHYMLRVGYTLDGERSALGFGRERLYERIIASVVVDEAVD
jgi:membrane associated rhomboid family serine protease